MPARERPTEMRFVGTSSGQGGCPTLWVTDRGTLVVQGTTVTDEHALDAMRSRGNGLPDHESAVEIPAELMPFVDVEALQRLAFADEDRPHFTVDPDAVARIPEVRR
ncbi:hypothetical protein LY13_004273 [Prauserella aidingensis]|uniref:hypothetical protein n=1 Tax=Prauserella aidingensis TaxID=387890 RepID=UPI0020A4D3F7|nr:hypothetical protein [Prauserella aidingensis]MCP2255497.1 hypothetical protein [Prauserella aidingensis]